MGNLEVYLYCIVVRVHILYHFSLLQFIETHFRALVNTDCKHIRCAWEERVFFSCYVQGAFSSSFVCFICFKTSERCIKNLLP